MTTTSGGPTGLDQRKPAQRYRRSARKLPCRLKVCKYPQGMVVRYVCRNGAIGWGFGKWVVVSTTLIEKYIGLEEMAAGKWRVYYRDTLLGYLDEQTLRIQDDLGRIYGARKKSVDDVLGRTVGRRHEHEILANCLLGAVAVKSKRRFDSREYLSALKPSRIRQRS
jgi:hypothetical protein